MHIGYTISSIEPGWTVLSGIRALAHLDLNKRVVYRGKLFIRLWMRQLVPVKPPIGVGGFFYALTHPFE